MTPSAGDMLPTRRQLLGAAAAAAAAALIPGTRAAARAPRPLYAPVATGEERGPPIPQGRATTRPLFRAPSGFPNALGVAPEGFWVAEQRFDGGPEPLHLMDWRGQVLRTITTGAKDSSGVAQGDGRLWVLADEVEAPGVFVTDLDGNALDYRQIPLGPAAHAGGGHGATWHDGHLWITANRPRAILRIDPRAWTVDYLIPFGLPEGLTRYHGCAVLGDSMYMVSGTESRRYREGGTSLIRYDLDSGAIRAVYAFAPGSCDPHGLMAHDGALYGCDSGFHPGWSRDFEVPGWGRRTSPTAGWIFAIDLA